MKPRQVACMFLFACTGPLVCAQTVAPFYSGTYSITNLGSVTGVPTNYGGLTFKAGDPNTILLGGLANNSSGRFYSVPVTRGAGNHIVSLGTATALGFGTHNDGGIAYGPGGVLFYSQYNVDNVGQVKPGDNSDDKTVALAPLGIGTATTGNSTGALNFVPAGYNGAGQFKISVYSGGGFYTVTLTADGSGTYNLGGASLQVTLPGGPEGFVYVPQGSTLFPSQSMLVAEYSNDSVATYTIDANGNPVLGSRQDFITGLAGAEGAAIDPVTGDFFFSTFGGSNQVIEVRGFVPPTVAPPTIAKAFGAATIPLNGSTSLTFTIANPNASSQVSGVTLNDSLPAGLVVSTPNGLMDGCGGVTATAGSGTIFLNDITLAANTSCTYSVNVTGTTLGLKNNVTDPITSAQGTGGTASASVTVVAVGPPPTNTPIPTLQQWALWVLGLLLIFSASVTFRRRKRN